MSRFILLAAAAALLAALAGPLFADPPAVIIIRKADVFGGLSRAPVRFTHADHVKLDGVSCLTCHHDFKNGKNVLDPGKLTPGDPSTQCAACHARPVELEKSFHALCITCHDAEKKKGRVTGPRSCGECHAWQK